MFETEQAPPDFLGTLSISWHDLLQENTVGMGVQENTVSTN